MDKVLANLINTNLAIEYSQSCRTSSPCGWYFIINISTVLEGLTHRVDKTTPMFNWKKNSRSVDHHWQLVLLGFPYSFSNSWWSKSQLQKLQQSTKNLLGVYNCSSLSYCLSHSTPSIHLFHHICTGLFRASKITHFSKNALLLRLSGVTRSWR